MLYIQRTNSYRIETSDRLVHSIRTIIVILGLFLSLINLPWLFVNYTPLSAQISPSPSLSPITSLEIIGNTELDAFCAGNSTDGLSPATAHVIEDLVIDGMYLDSQTRFKLVNIDRYLILRNLHITRTAAIHLVSGAGVYLETCANIRIENCVIDHQGIFGMRILDSENITLESCYFNNNTVAGIECEESTSLDIFNVTSIGSTSAGLSVRDNSSSIFIANSTICDNDQNGVSFTQSTNITLHDSLISTNGLNGINFRDSKKIFIKENRIEKNGNYGIYVDDATAEVTIQANVLLQNTRGCVRLPDDPNEITLIGNDCKDPRRILGYPEWILFGSIALMVGVIFRKLSQSQ